MNMDKLLHERIRLFRIDEDRLRKDIAMFLSDYNFVVNADVELCSLTNDYVWSDHDTTYGQCVYQGMLFLTTYDRKLKDLTDEDIDRALRKGQAVSIDDLSFNDLCWLLEQYDQYKKDKKNRLLVVKQEIVNKDGVIAKTISSSTRNFEQAKQWFHDIEKKLVEQGYELDDDTTDYTEEYIDTDDFFNNATNDDTTVRIFIEED